LKWDLLCWTEYMQAIIRTFLVLNYSSFTMRFICEAKKTWMDADCVNKTTLTWMSWNIVGLRTEQRDAW
jgi:hypothetical protein